MSPKYLLLVFLLIFCHYVVAVPFCSSFIPLQGLKKSPRLLTKDQLFSAYIPPELDPDYQKQTNSLLNINDTLPYPKEGDIVQFQGKWPGEMDLGKIRFLSYDTYKKKWIADILPLKEGKSENVFAIDRDARTFFANIDDLQPIRSFFLRSENGYKIATKKNSTEFVVKAAAYRPMNENYTLPIAQKSVNMSTLVEDLSAYAELKARLIKTTLIYGAVGTVVTTGVFGLDVSLPYLAGSWAGALYLYLLGKRTDKIGSGYAIDNKLIDSNATTSSITTTPSSSKLDDLVTNSRLLVPVILMALLAAKNNILHEREILQFQALSKQQFLGAAAGFLTYSVAVLVSEVFSEIRTEDWLSFIPGSVAESFRRLKGLKKKKDELTAEQLKKQTLVSVVVLTGPRAAGRSRIASKLATGGLNLVPVPILSTDASYVMKQNMLETESVVGRYQYISEEDLAKESSQGGMLFEGQVTSLLGDTVKFAVRRSDVIPLISDSTTTNTAAAASTTSSRKFGKRKQTLLLDGPPAMLEALSKAPELRLFPIWISLQTKEQFVDKAMSVVRDEVRVETLAAGSSTIGGAGASTGNVLDRSDLARRSAEEVSMLVNEAAKDVTYYMQRAPIFLYTILNTGVESEVVEELEQMLSTTI